jgi:hypothetical protein
MPGYICITEHEPAALAPVCQFCGFTTRHKQGADDAWTCEDCDDQTADVLADALISCIVRLDDLGEGDGPTAKHARAALRRAGR